MFSMDMISSTPTPSASTTNPNPNPNTQTNLTPILKAAKEGDAEELEKLLNEKSEHYDHSLFPEYPQDWKYDYRDLLRADQEGRTSLQLACSVGNHEMALKCVQILIECLQVAAPDHEDDYRDKSYEYINYTLHGKQSALHLAIENKATKVISFLLDRNANLAAKSLKGIDALTLICQQVPDALAEVYDNAIQLMKDHKGFLIDWGPLIGVRKQVKIVVTDPDPERSPRDTDKTDEGGNYMKIPADEKGREAEDEGRGGGAGGGAGAGGGGGGTDVEKSENGNGNASDNNSLVVDFWKETEYLSYILSADKWGTNLLLHPLVKLFLELKWNKIHWFFWIPFLLEILWLLMYSVAFVQLQLYVEAISNNESVTSEEAHRAGVGVGAGTETGSVVRAGTGTGTGLGSGTGSGTGPGGRNKQDLDVGVGDEDPIGNNMSPPLVLWTVLFFITLLAGGKELYAGCVLRRAYFTFENLAQVSFILLYVVQFGLLMGGYPERVATISAVGIALSTTLMIFQLGKTPLFGQQVAAMKKVIYSCAPHMPLFFVWFLGFCLIFWALFYKSSESSVIVLFAIVAAMGTGELNAKDHFEESLKRSLELHDLISVFCLILFIIAIVTLYFNLLIGYAVSDIQLLKQKAEAFEMSNRLSTIYTIESFLLSKIGRMIVRFKSGLGSAFAISEWREVQEGNKPKLRGDMADEVMNSNQVYMESIYVIPPSQFQKSATLPLRFENIPPKILKQFKEIAYGNLLKEKERHSRFLLQLQKLERKGS